MQSSLFNTPALYGDHHVTEIRRILFNVPGVNEVYASSAFRVVEVQFDETKTSHQAIAQLLEESGYLGEIQMMAETGVAAQRSEGDGFFRHTATYEALKSTVSFAQTVPYSGRPLWNCPGMGVVRSMDED